MDEEPHLNVPVDRGVGEVGGRHEYGFVVGHDGFGVQSFRQPVYLKEAEL